MIYPELASMGVKGVSSLLHADVQLPLLCSWRDAVSALHAFGVLVKNWVTWAVWVFFWIPVFLCSMGFWTNIMPLLCHFIAYSENWYLVLSSSVHYAEDHFAYPGYFVELSGF